MATNEWPATTGDLLEAAWGLIANVGNGNWETQAPEWQGAASRWRDRYHALSSRAPMNPLMQFLHDVRG